MPLIETLQDLVHIPSLSGKERIVLNYIQQNLRAVNLDPFFQDGNLVVHLAGKNRNKAFIFNSHVDVVDPGDESRWTHNGPWSATIEKNQMFGRGTSDMKAGVAASMELAKQLTQSGTPLCDVFFTYVVQEETDGAGTRAFADWLQFTGQTGRYDEMAAIFTEPTSLINIEHGHRGNYFIRAQIQGDAGHASRPKNIKTHAINAMVDFMRDLEVQSRKWEEQFPTNEFIAPTITPTAIEASTGSPNKVSDLCIATFDLRTIPQWDEQAYEQIGEIAKQRGIDISLIVPNSPTGYTKKDARIIRVFQREMPNTILTVSQASADLGFLSRIGVDGVIFGPGDIEKAHIIDESVDLNQVLKTPEIYKKVYEEWAKE